MSRYCGQPWWSTAGFKILAGSFSQVELGGLEPPTPCLQITRGSTGMVRDVRSRLRRVRLRPLPFGVVATGTSYREVCQLQQFTESHRPVAFSSPKG